MSEKFRNNLKKPLRSIQETKEIINEMPRDAQIDKFMHAVNIGGLSMTQFVMWLAKYITLDNHVTRAGENFFSKINVGKTKNGKDKKIPKFVKQNPNFVSIASWWMLLASLYGGGKAVMDKTIATNNNNQEIKDIKEIDNFNDDDEKYEPGTYGAYFDKLRTITPFVIAGLIEYEGVRVNEEGLHVVYDDATGKPLKPGKKPKGNATIGFGSTVLKDGTKVTSYTKPITTEEAYELARWHLEESETYFGMYCYDTAFDTIDINSVSEAVAIADIMYNGFSNFIEPAKINKKPNRQLGDRFGTLRQIYKEKGAGLTEQDVLDAFNQYPVGEKNSFGEAWLGGKPKKEVGNTLGNFLKNGAGLQARRWIEAGLLSGALPPEVLLDCPMDGVSEFRKYKGSKKSAFWKKNANKEPVVNESTYAEFLQWLKNPVNKKGQSIAHWKKVRDYMPDYALAACDGKKCQLGDKAPQIQRKRQREVSRQTYVLNYDSLYTVAINAYKSKDYKSAATQLERLVSENQNNALLHNDLAATYNHLGLYKEAIAHAQEIVFRIGDKSQYAAAQYNAGYAYEQLGDLQKALANYKLAVANGNYHVQSDVTRISNMIKNRTSHKAKKIAFNDAAGRIKSKSKQNKIASIKKISINDERRA